MLKRASEVIAQGDLGEVVDYAIDLFRQASKIEAQLDEVKVHLRKVARERAQGAKTVDLDGLTGSITVSFPGLAIKTKKGADLKDLEVNVPPEVFAELFRNAVVITPALDAEEFLDRLKQLNPAHRARINHFVSIEEQTGKVFIPR